jgi:hypothetical protein
MLNNGVDIGIQQPEDTEYIFFLSLLYSHNLRMSKGATLPLD